MALYINKKKIGSVAIICKLQILENKSVFLSLAKSNERVLIHFSTEKFRLFIL